MSNAISAYGTLLKRGDGGGPETFTTVPEVRVLNGPTMETDEAEVTSHSSAAAGAFREFILTLIDLGTLDFEYNYVPTDAQHIGIRNDWQNRVKRNWQLVLPGSVQTISFTGYVKTHTFDFPVDDAMMVKGQIRLTGAPTFS